MERRRDLAPAAKQRRGEEGEEGGEEEGRGGGGGGTKGARGRGCAHVTHGRTRTNLLTPSHPDKNVGTEACRVFTDQTDSACTKREEEKEEKEEEGRMLTVGVCSTQFFLERSQKYLRLLT